MSPDAPHLLPILTTPCTVLSRTTHIAPKPGVFHYATAAASLLKSPRAKAPTNIAGPSRHGALLLSDGHKAEHALTEAIQSLKSSDQLRSFFVHLLVNDHVASPITMWNTFQDALAHDFILRHDNVNLGVNETLQELNRALEEHGRSLTHYGLPQPAFHSREVEMELEKWEGQLDMLAARSATAVSKLNKEQYGIYKEIMDAVMHKRSLCAFVDGKAGRGKTFLVNTICNKLRSEGHIVLPTATSAFAAQLYPGGKTTHSVFKVSFQLPSSPCLTRFQLVHKVPIVGDENDELVSPIGPHDPRGELIRESSAIIWDEAPMAKSEVLTCVEETCRRVMRNNLPFGGKVVVLLGDFRQTCPVVRQGTRRQVVDASIRSSPLWREFTTFRLQQPIRNAEDLPYADFVDLIGDGAGPYIPLDLLQHVHNRSSLIEFVYPEDVLRDPALCLTRAILAPTNSQVDAYNTEILSQIEGFSRTFYAVDTLQDPEEVDDTSPDLLLEQAERDCIPGIPAHNLEVKVHGVYRLMCNFAPDRGLVKNTRVVIMHIGRRIITVRILRGAGGVGSMDTEDVLISRIPFNATLPSGHTLVRRQFPLAPAYATTFNSCQGLTLDVVGVDLTRPVFSHGQLYTALSRIRHRSHAKVRLHPWQKTTKNVTYHEVLL